MSQHGKQAGRASCVPTGGLLAANDAEHCRLLLIFTTARLHASCSPPRVQAQPSDSRGCVSPSHR